MLSLSRERSVALKEENHNWSSYSCKEYLTGEGGTPNVTSTGMCRCEGYGFQVLKLPIEYRNQPVVALKRYNYRQGGHCINNLVLFLALYQLRVMVK